MRMINLKAAAIFFLAFLFSEAASSQPVLWRGDLHRTGIYRTEPLLKPAGMKWKVETGCKMVARVLVDGQTLFPVGCGVVHAVDRKSGREKFQVKFNYPYESFFVKHHVLYLISSNAIGAWDAVTGKLSWKKTFGNEIPFEVSGGVVLLLHSDKSYGFFDLVERKEVSQFSIEGKHVFFLLAQSGKLYYGDGKQLVSVDLNTGKEDWKFQLAFVADDLEMRPVASSSIVCVWSKDKHIYALDAGSGKIRWKIESIAMVDPLIDDGILYYCSADGLHAVSLQTGRENWKYHGRDLGVFSINGNNLYMWNSSDRNYLGAVRILVLNRATGKEKGIYFLPFPFSGTPFERMPILINGMAYYGSLDGSFLAVDLKAFRKLFLFRTTEKVASSPAVWNGIVFFGCDNGYLYAIDKKNGKERWKFETGGPIESSPAIDDGTVYFGSDDRNFYALNAKIGREKWRFESEFGISSSPAIYRGRIYFGSEDHYFYSLDEKTGREIWRFRTADRIESSPAIDDGTVYFGSNDGKLYAVDAETGKEVWHFLAGSDIASTPVVAKRAIYLISYGRGPREYWNRYLYQLNLRNGKESGTGQGALSDFSSYPIFWHDRLYFVDNLGRLKVFGPGTLAKESFFSVPQAVADSILYYLPPGTSNVELKAVSLRTGKSFWNYVLPSESPATSSPVISGGAIYIATSHGIVVVR